MENVFIKVLCVQTTLLPRLLEAMSVSLRLECTSARQIATQNCVI